MTSFNMSRKPAGLSNNLIESVCDPHSLACNLGHSHRVALAPMSTDSGSGDAGSGSDQDGASPSTPPVPPMSPPAPPPDAELQGARCARICKELRRVCMPHVGIRAETEVLAYYLGAPVRPRRTRLHKHARKACATLLPSHYSSNDYTRSTLA